MKLTHLCIQRDGGDGSSVVWFVKRREMEEPKTEDKIENFVSNLSKGAIGHEVDIEATRGLRVVKLHKGFMLCEFLVHSGVSDGNGKWHEGAMATLIDFIATLTAFSFTAQDHVTVHLSVSYHSKPNLREEVQVEGKVMGTKGRMTSVGVEVRKKHNGETVALGNIWMGLTPPNSSATRNHNNNPLSSKL